MGLIGRLLEESGGTGAHGTWMPSDDFLNGKRSTSWTTLDAEGVAPARMYVDQCRIFRQVINLRTLKRGDHCIIAAKLFRTVSRSFDFLTSFVSYYDFVGVYHHFVLLDDVATVDEFGVPRSDTGSPVNILEHTNTCREAARIVWFSAGRSLLGVPRVLLPFFCNMGQCKSVPLCDYGDFPCFFKFEDQLHDETREQTVINAGEMEANHEPYNMFTNNCEHCANIVCSKGDTSQQVLVFLRNLGFLVGRCSGLALVLWSRNASPKIHRFALALYYSIAVRSTGVHALFQFNRVRRCVEVNRAKGRISRSDGYHLLVHEGARACFTGVGAFLSAICLPRMIFGGYISPSRGVNVCAFGYCVLDIIYGIAAQTLR